MAEQKQQHQYQSDSESLSFPEDTVVGIVNDPDGANAVLTGLIAAGIPADRITMLCGNAGADRLDARGKRHGLLGKLRRLVQNYGDEDLPHVRRQADELRAGNFLISAPANQDERELVANVLVANGGHFINHYGGWAVTRLRD